MSQDSVSTRFWAIAVVEQILESLDEPHPQQSELWLGVNQTQNDSHLITFTNLRESNINVNTSNVFP